MVTEVNRSINWSKLILAFLVATLLFFLGIFLGYLGKAAVENSTISLEESVKNELLSLETLSLLDDQFSCDSSVLNLVSKKLDYLGSTISDLEVKKGKFDKHVLELKKLYTILEVKHLLLMKERIDSCSEKYNLILFFYSNERKCSDIVERTSFILTYLRNKHESVRVYSFDLDLNSDIISVLSNKYNLDGCFAVVLNDVKVAQDNEIATKDIEILLNTSLN